jgi:RNA polymerase sigma-70 factor, ECF subfamily
MDQKSITKETLQEFIAGSPEAFTRIYWAYFPNALELGRRLFREDEVARDFVQDLFARVWEKRDRFKDVEDVKSYLYGMAWKLAADRQSKATSRYKLLQQYFTERQHPVSTGLEMQYSNQEIDQIVERALESTPARGQKIFKLKEQGLSRTEIARQLNLAQHTVDNDLSLTMKAIRTYIKSHAISILLMMAGASLLLI